MAEEIRIRFSQLGCTITGPALFGRTDLGSDVLDESPDGMVRVWEHCLQASHIDEPLAMHAQQLEEQAQKTRSLIGRLKVSIRGVDRRRGAR